MCLPYKEIEPYLHYYAGRFQSNRFDHWELVNEAWIAIHDLTNPKFASAGIRWAMQAYTNRQYMQDHRGNTKSVIQSIDEEIKEGLFCKGFIVAPKDRWLQISEDFDYVYHLLGNPNIGIADKLLIDQRYYQGLMLRQIAKIYGCAPNTILHRLNKIIDKLKCITEAA